MERRTPLRRGGPIQRKTELRRGGPIRRRNPERAAKAYARAFGDKAAWIRSLPCSTCRAPGPSDPSHVRSRGAGGTAADLIPQCRRCHQRYHQIGAGSFAAEVGVDLRDLAASYEAFWQAMQALPPALRHRRPWTNRGQTPLDR
ncbi:MAG: hypothetical protein AAGN46_01195 [Acidobacteriota bacterium]